VKTTSPASFNKERIVAWICLFVAGLFEVGWAAGLKASAGFTRLACVAFIVAGIVGLKLSSEQ
jgi:multidrug transporter EmrE-like cation transporter